MAYYSNTNEENNKRMRAPSWKPNTLIPNEENNKRLRAIINENN